MVLLGSLTGIRTRTTWNSLWTPSKQIKEEHPEYFQVFGLTIDRIYGYISQGLMRNIPAEGYILSLLGLVLIIIATHPSASLFLERENGSAYTIGMEDWKAVVVDMFMRTMLEHEK